MLEQRMEDNANNDEVIASAIESISFFLFSVLAECYPDIATSELESIFHDELKIDIISFVRKYRQEVINGNAFSFTGKHISQVYANQRFFEKLSIALERCKKDKPKYNAEQSKTGFRL